ncbi:MAG: DEAD/DEAH box helicase [Candidatus Fluviicola riflensis]|nr:MAG: DEAD/DEAH box helicase [Candidatus Fluviicola riflensis]OGS79582.1 MAG: DEAD/DEAH box helicase [Candidatus Fluviicola riflensis]OGS87013.1 MAG: DEAD/DEAH box helicase [Fluviicola sp. RIFCSPHIGHO2_01_FULL_43_53]OGS89805.1 MAG: DEAD/DEAH box helicase [Fluviicola sp. RIFCSPHIGHO2_12_FULL_43_24]
MIDSELFEAKKLYPFQEKTVAIIMDELEKNGADFNLLFQLPTGGGKTVIFSEVAQHYIKKHQKKVLILTHRIELSVQTSRQLSAIGIANKVISSEVKNLVDEDHYPCYIAMVETLNNRLQEDENFVDGVGLVIVDEAHYNSFRKIFQYYAGANILGVTATPLSSNKTLPLNDHYNKLIVGESISSLIGGGYLADAETFTYDVNLHGLKIGSNGDFTVSSSELVYGNYFMQEKLLFAYEEVAVGDKTLIFNSGIETSLRVEETFKKRGFKIRHLDSTFSDKDRKDVLHWFKHTKDAILTSVGILTTGFDEPTVETIILNRATRSLTLYHQMIGRGSRRLPHKEKFKLIDLGNNVRRFGIWQDYINWHDAFRFPDRFLESRLSEDDDLEFEVEFEFPKHMEELVDTNFLEAFSMRDVYYECLDKGDKGKQAVDMSLKNHCEGIARVTNDFERALKVQEALQEHIEHRLKMYTKCIAKSTPNYFKYLMETYNRQLRQELRMALDDIEENDN